MKDCIEKFCKLFEIQKAFLFIKLTNIFPYPLLSKNILNLFVEIHYDLVLEREKEKKTEDFTALYFPNYSIWSDLEMALMDSHLHGLLSLLMPNLKLPEHSRINHCRHKLRAPVIRVFSRNNLYISLKGKLRWFSTSFLVSTIQIFQHLRSHHQNCHYDIIRACFIFITLTTNFPTTVGKSVYLKFFQ